MQIVNLFYSLALKHKRINGFIYGKSYEKGSGKEFHPLVWLDDPILGRSAGPTNNAIAYTTNFDVLGIPAKDSEVEIVQDAAFSAGLSIINQIKKLRDVEGFTVDNFSFVSLRDYYDNKAAGFRFTLNLTTVNPSDICADDYDPAKQFPDASVLPDFSTAHPEGCAVFSNTSVLPNFKTT